MSTLEYTDNSLDQSYINDLERCEFLTRAEEIRLHQKMVTAKLKRTRDKARNRLIEAVLPLSVGLAKRNLCGEASLKDRVGGFNLHLAEKMCHFDPARGRLTTFVYAIARTYFPRAGNKEHLIKWPTTKWWENEKFNTIPYVPSFDDYFTTPPDEIPDQDEIYPLLRRLKYEYRFAVRARIRGITLERIGIYCGVTKEMIRQRYERGIRLLKVMVVERQDGKELYKHKRGPKPKRDALVA